MEIEESSNEREFRSEATDEESEFRDWDCEGWEWVVYW
jgi:hypothetical protein